MIPLLFIKSIYAAMGQDKQVASMAATYVHIVMWGLYGHMLASSGTQYAASQGKTLISFLVILTSTLVHVVGISIFVIWFQWGFFGMCLATMIQ